MRKWGFAVAGLYFVALVVLSCPVALAAFWPKSTMSTILEMYGAWTYWIWIAVLICGEVLLLVVPIHQAEGRLRDRRPLLVPVITSCLFFSLLVFFFVWTVTFAIWGDEGGTFGLSDRMFWVVTGGAVAVLWAAWAAVFHHFSKSDAPDALIRRATTWLLKGSILELLVAVSCHVVVRRRDECCAPFGTFLGIAAGLSIMLLSFGPGVFALFVERCRKLKPRDMPPG
jgi:hypothetical protein